MQKTPRKINAPIYPYAEALYMAFYSRRLYVDVAKRWTGVGFFYFLFLIALLSIPLSIRAVVEFERFFDEEVIWPIQQIPPLQIQKGDLQFDKPMPYLVKKKSGEVVTVIDTTGAVSIHNNPYPELMLLVTKNKLYFRPPALALQSSSSSHDTFKVQTFNKNDTSLFFASDWLQSSHLLWLKWGMVVLAYPCIAAFIFGLGFSFLLIFSMLAQAFAWLVLRSKLTFNETARMLFVASTAPLTLFMILTSANAVFHGSGWICVGLLSVYFSLSVLSLKREMNQMVRA